MSVVYSSELTLDIFTEPDSPVEEVAAVEPVVGNPPAAEDSESYLQHRDGWRDVLFV